MPFQGPKTIRTARSIALEKGTDPKGFTPQVPYCPQCGMPTGVGLPHGHYIEQGPFVSDASRPADPKAIK